MLGFRHQRPHLSLHHHNSFWTASDELPRTRIAIKASAMGTLCQYCKVLEIDDAAWGGSRDESIPGKTVLSFSGGITEKLSYRRNAEILKEYPNEGEYAIDRRAPAQYRRFICRYDRQDTSPDLPSLKESAAVGCRPCALLRYWIRSQISRTRGFNSPASTVFIRSLMYTWYETIRKTGIPFRVIRGLEIDVIVEGIRNFRSSSLKIYASEGNKLLNYFQWLNINTKT